MAKVSILKAVRDAKKQDRKARLDRAKTKTKTTDSFQNFEARLGLGTDNLSSGGTYGFFPVTRNRTLLEWIHRGSWVGGVAVDVKGDDMTRAGVEITANDLDIDEIEEIHEAAGYLNIWPAVNDCVRWSALYGGALCVILIEGQDLSTPLRIESIKPLQFKGLITLDRWMVDPSLNDLVADYGPDLGLPKYYTVTANAPALRGKKIHFSRVLRMVGIDLPYQQRMAENLWGISVYERLYDRMLAFDSATTGAAQLVYKSYLRTYKIEDLRENIAAGGPQLEGTVQYVDFMAKYQSIEGITLMDAKDDFAEHGAQSFGGIGEALSKFGEQIAGALQMPLVRLFGQSPAGFSSGDSDIRAYYDSIKQQQEKHLRIPMTTIYRCIAKTLGMDLGDGFKIEFRSLWQMTDAEKATVGNTVTSMIVNAKEAGLITLKTAMEELRRFGSMTGFYATTISDEDISNADDGEPPMPLDVETAAMKQGDPNKEDAKGLEQKTPPKSKGKDSAATFNNVAVLAAAGLQIVIENPKGTIRQGVGWEMIMPADYGYIRSVTGADGDQLDCFIGPNPYSKKVFSVAQRDLSTGEFDEHKVMLGCGSLVEATNLYVSAYDSHGLARIMNIDSFDTIPEFVAWMKKNFDHTLDSAEFREQEHPHRANGEFGPKGTLGNAGSGKADLGKWASVFASPNKGNMNFSEAITAMKSPQQKEFENHVKLFLRTSLHTTDAKSKSCLGVWADGAENSAHFTFSATPDDLKYAAAVIGLDADQKAVLTWRPETEGKHKLHVLEAKGSIEEMTQKLEEGGIEFSTIEEDKSGLSAYILDEDGSLSEKVSNLRVMHGFNLQTNSGVGEFIGGWGDREECHKIQRGIIDDYKNRHQLTGDATPAEKVECQIFVGGLKRGPTNDAASFKENEHPRKNDGKFTAGAGGMSLKPVKKRAWSGQQIDTKTKLSKQETGNVGEAAVIEYLKTVGVKDARSLNTKVTNFPVDLIGDHRLVEVKSGLVSNGPSAQQWRATIGQPGKEETKWLAKADPEEKREWNQAKAQAILDRKNKVLKDYQKKIGKKIKAYTITTIINPDTKTVDVYQFDGFHSRIAWNSEEAKTAHKGTYAYTD